MEQYFFHTLKNGIRLVHKPVDNIVAHAGIIINTGSRDELPEEHGIAHFIEHTIFKGTKKRKVYHVLSRLENVGADLNAYTTKEETVIYASFVKDHYDRTLELISDITFNSTFPAKEIEKEKDIIVDEIESYKDSPAELIFDEFEDQIFDGHSIGRNILGTEKNIRKFTREDITRFIKDNYHTDQIVICSVGSIDFNKLVNKVEKYFAHIPENIRSFKRSAFSDYIPLHRVFDRDTHQTHCMIGNVAYSYKEKQKNAFTLLNNILGGPGLNSRLNLGIREKYGFAYNIESNYTPYTDSGVFMVYLGTALGYADRSINLVYKELKKLRESKLGVMQMRISKQQFIGQLAISYESNLNDMLSIGKSYLHFDKVDTLEDIHRKINAITADELLQTANEVFDMESLSSLAYKKIEK